MEYIFKSCIWVSNVKEWVTLPVPGVTFRMESTRNEPVHRLTGDFPGMCYFDGKTHSAVSGIIYLTGLTNKRSSELNRKSVQSLSLFSSPDFEYNVISHLPYYHHTFPTIIACTLQPSDEINPCFLKLFSYLVSPDN